jgi:hypothetical protein
MPELNEQFEAIERLKKQYEEAVKAIGREGIQKLLEPLFERYPNVDAVKWTQYTPYFNDGEPCEFDSNADYAEVRFKAEEGDVLTKESQEQDFESDWGNREKPERYNAIKAIRQALKIDNAVMLAAFGDHVEVTVDRNSVEVEEFEHE